MSHSRITPNITVTRFQLTNQRELDKIKADWINTFESANASFFLSWRWISAFAHTAITAGYTLHVVKASLDDNSVAGLAIFCERTETRHKLVKFRQLLLHKTGNEALDKSWIEYNDLLVHAEYEQATRKAIWEYVLRHFNNIDEFVLGLCTQQAIAQNAQYLQGLLTWDYINSTGFVLKLSNCAAGKYHSKQTSSQIRRSNKLLAAAGAEVCIIDDSASYLSALETLAPLHKKTWGEQSGFNVGAFSNHLRSLADTQDNTRIVSACLKGNGITYAALIGFVHRNRFYYYLSASELSSDNKIKYGLSLHHFVIEWCRQQGIQFYDFLAGDYRYKRSFTIDSVCFRYTYFQRPSLKAKIENTLRTLKRRLFVTQ